MVSVDFAGAFNNVVHSYMWEVLRRYGLSEALIELLQSLYDGATTRVRLNGQLGAAILLGRGVRQGCPLSMLLFCIVISPLLRYLSRKLLGVSVPDVKGNNAVFKLATTAYVDDATVVLTQPGEVRVLADALESFGAESGLRINPAKTKALPLGSWGTSISMPYPYVDKLKVLGIVFTKTTAGMLAANWPARLQALRGVLVDARLRALNLLQRVQYANMFALSLLWHCAQVLPMPAGTAKDSRKALSRFLWAGEPVRIPLDVMVQPLDRGGLGLHDPIKKSRAMFVAKWLTAARTTDYSLSGGWLAVLQTLYEDDTALPPPAKFYAALRTTCSEVDVPDDMHGQALNRAILKNLLLLNPVVPRVQRLRPAAEWGAIWPRIHAKILPLPARTAWFRAVHDILPTNARLHATHQADSAQCRTCGAEDTALHPMTSCRTASRDIWRWTAAKLAALTDADVRSLRPDVLLVPDFATPSVTAANAAAWLLGTAVRYLVESAAPEKSDFIDCIVAMRENVTCHKVRKLLNILK